MSEPAARIDTHRNNFDLLRLLAALQVVFFHSNLHLKVHLTGAVVHALDFFPGVPIFFTISGFLISLSYERSRSLAAYARNRFLRIYPALWVCFALSLGLLAAFGMLKQDFILSRRFAAWVLTQLSFLQFYHPDALRSFGVGVVNGSLWTISVELGFYVTLPILYLALSRTSRGVGTIGLLVLSLASFAVNYFFVLQGGRGETLHSKLLFVSIAPHLFMFLFGVLAQRYYAALRGGIEGRVALWTAAYIALMVIQERAGLEKSFPYVLLTRFALSAWTLSFAFSFRGISERLLRGNDISYGVYIYHMLVVNAFVQLGLTYQFWHMVGAFGATLALGMLSWKLVEKPALALKKGTLRGVSGPRKAGDAGTPRIALVGSFPPPYGGCSVHVQRLKQGLEAEGYDVSAVDFYSGGGETEPGVHRCGTDRPWNLLRAMAALRRLAPDVAHFHIAAMGNFSLAGHLLLAVLPRGTRTFVSIHSGSFVENFRAFSPTRRRLAAALLRRFDRVITVNDEQRALVEGIIGAEGGRGDGRAVSVIPAYLPPVAHASGRVEARLRELVAHGRPIVISSGYGLPHYGFHILLDAFEKLGDAAPALILCLYNTYDEAYVAGLTARLGRFRSAVFRDLAPEEFSYLLSKSDVYVRATDRDGDAVAIREAAFFGKKIVASDAVPRPNGCAIFKRDDAEDLRQILGRALGGQLEAVPAFNHREALERLLSVYRGV